MRRYLAYLSYVVRHRWYVMLECWRVGLVWRGLIHDLSKFRPSEFRAYAYHFYSADGSKRQARDGDAAFDRAWMLHAARNDHHWQWWVLPREDGTTYAHAMSEAAWREMVCDWHGAARAQGVADASQDRLSVLSWWAANRSKMYLHPYTELVVQSYLLKRRAP